MSREVLVGAGDRRAAIVEAAAELFAARGYAAVGVDEIGAAAGISGPAIYRHFTGKEAILSAILTKAAAALEEATTAVCVTGGPPAVEELARSLTTSALDGPTYLATYLRERHRLSGPDEVAVRTLEHRVVRSWRTALSSARPDLDSLSLRIRQAGVTGALSEATSRPSVLGRPRLDELLTRAAAAVVLAARPAENSSIAAPKWARPPGKRDEILAVALKRLAQRGFHGVGMDEIGAAAGISGPTVYHYYASKAELLVDAFDRIGERVMAGAEDAVRTSRSAAEALGRLAQSYTLIAGESADLIVVTAREGFSIPESERTRLSRRRRRLRDYWSGVVSEVRTDLSEAEIRLLVRMVFPLVNAAILVDGDHIRGSEIAALAVASIADS